MGSISHYLIFSGIVHVLFGIILPYLLIVRHNYFHLETRLNPPIYQDEGQDLTRAEFEQIVATARTAGKDRITLIMEKIA